MHSVVISLQLETHKRKSARTHTVCIEGAGCLQLVAARESARTQSSSLLRTRVRVHARSRARMPRALVSLSPSVYAVHGQVLACMGLIRVRACFTRRREQRVFHDARDDRIPLGPFAVRHCAPPEFRRLCRAYAQP
jgi:hypothetical protein